MTGDAPDGEWRIAVRVADPRLARRLAGLLADVAGFRPVAGDAPADLILSAADGDGDLAALTARERDVLALLAEGLSNRAIAARLGIAPDTAKFYVGRVLDKLDATGRTDAVAHAVRRGIIHL